MYVLIPDFSSTVVDGEPCEWCAGTRYGVEFAEDGSVWFYHCCSCGVFSCPDRVFSDIIMLLYNVPRSWLVLTSGGDPAH